MNIKSDKFYGRFLKVTFSFIILLQLLAPTAYAAEPPKGNGCDGKNIVEFQVPLGKLTGTPSLGCYLDKIYQLSIAIVGIVAIVMIMIGGVKWITAAGSGRVNEAKDYIQDSLMGMLILIGAYTLLRFINPQLTIVGVEVTQLKPAGIGRCTEKTTQKCIETPENLCDPAKNTFEKDKKCGESCQTAQVDPRLSEQEICSILGPGYNPAERTKCPGLDHAVNCCCTSTTSSSTQPPPATTPQPSNPIPVGPTGSRGQQS